MRYVGVATIMAIIFVALACGGDDEAALDSEANPTPQIIEMTVKDFSFVPPKLRGTIGAPIEITLKNTGQAAHTFTIDEFNVDTEVAAGEETKVTVLPPEPGEFNYYCRFHEEQGMRGAINTTAEGVEAPGQPTNATEEPADEAEEDPFDY